MIPNSNLLPSNTTNRMLRGLGSTALFQIINAIYPIVLVPLFIRAWGSDGYGRWISLSAFVFYFGILDLGGQNYIGNLIAKAYAEGDKIAFRKYLSEGVSLFGLIAIAGFFALAALLFLPVLSLPQQSVLLTDDERFILLALGANLLQMIPNGVYVTVYRSTGRLVRGVMLGNLLKITTFFILAIVLLLHYSPVLYAFVTFMGGVVNTVVIVWDIPRIIPEAGNLELNISVAFRGRIHLQGSIYFWLLALGQALSFQGVILVISATNTPESVALYSTHRTVAGLIGYISTLVLTPLWPELSFAYAQRQKEKLNKMAILAIKIVVYLASISAIMLWLVFPTIYPLWTGKQLIFIPALLGCLLLQGVLNAGWATSGWSLLATNKHTVLARWSFVNALMSIILSIYLVQYLGVLGIAISVLVSDLVCGFLVYPWIAAPIIGSSVRQIYQAILLPIAFFVPVTLAILTLISLVSPFVGILLGCIAIIVTSGIAFTFVFDQDERIQFVNALASFLGKLQISRTR